jgi:mRNA interferase MazF
MNTFKIFDIVVVPFPFVDAWATKNRPALIVSSEKYFNKQLGHTLLAMITSTQHNPWPLDIEIEEPEKCGLLKSSIIRLKLFTLDNRLIKTRIGRLSANDQLKMQMTLIHILELKSQ